MLFEAERSARAASYALPASGAVARPLSQRAFPKLLDPPTFRPRTLADNRPWPERLRAQLTRRVLIASAIAAFALVLATALPALAALRASETAAPRSTYSSSAGVTATAATRVDDLGAATFVGQIPFVQQLHYISAVSGVQPEASGFVLAARQATLAQYVQDVSTQVTLPYLSDAVASKRAVEAWASAVEAQTRQQAVAAAVSSQPWQAPPVGAGTTIAGATVTFYACIGNGFCGTMASGGQAFEGAAACSSDLAFGTRFIVANDPTGRVFTCLDRGALSATWVDVWFYDAADGWAWQSYVGTVSDIIIVG